MKKVVLVLVLSLAVVANANLYISVNGVVNPPDSTITITPSTWIVLGVGESDQVQPGPFALGLSMGPGSLDVSRMVTQQGVTAVLADNAIAAEALGLQNPFISMEVANAQIGMLVNEVNFHCDGPGDVTLALVDKDGIVVDTQVIHQIPEPITVVLLGLGGLFLRRRIA
jgi:hypothetical protein